MKKLTIVGQGPGSLAYQLAITKELVLRADLVLNSRDQSLSQLMSRLSENTKENVLLFVSGDSGFHSISQYIREKFAQDYEVKIYPGISSISLFAAALGKSYEKALLLSLHGQDFSILGPASYNKEIFALTGGQWKAQNIAQTLTNAGLGAVHMAVGQELSLPAEKIVQGLARDFIHEEFSDLAVVYLENPSAVDVTIPLRDEDFIRAKVPMTKEEVRGLIVRKLAPDPFDTLWDIGSGTGAVAIELARAAHRGQVCGVEMSPDALDCSRRNREHLGAYNLEIVPGRARTVISTLAKPDKVFVGGSDGDLREIVAGALEKNPEVRLLVSCVSLQNLQACLNLRSEFSERISFEEVVQLQVAKSKTLGRYDLLMAANPISLFLWQFGQKKEVL